MQAWSEGRGSTLVQRQRLFLNLARQACCSKKRRPRGWRHPDLDASLTRKRMTNEIKLTIWLARRGAPVPAIWDVDIEESKSSWRESKGSL
ncbi:MAG: hypothetical protein CM15mP9_0800 [Methanobacteriota archaeon]|nr:MAG: hypothetical protein CM15mP9_0800 [Euryarchaeota archaeon]